LRDGLKDGSTEADAAKDALYALANSNPTFQKLADQLAPLLDMLKNAIAAAGLLKGQLADLGGGPSFRQAENDSMSAYKNMKDAADKFIADAQKRNALSKDELALENEIARVKGEAEKAGIELSDKRIKALAEENLAAQKRRSDEGKTDRDSEYDRLTKSIERSTAAQLAENDALARSNPLVEDYGFALAKARAEVELMNAAKEDGREMTPELAAEIDQLSTKYAQAAAAGNKLSDVQDQIRQEAEEMSNLLKGTFESMVDALFEAGDIGKKLISIFADLGRPYTNMNVKQLWEI
jgi:chromosome segregation ATPase